MAATLKQKTGKMLDIRVEGYHLICIMHYDQKTNPYHLYLQWRDDNGNHLKQVARYGNFISVIEYIRIWMHNNDIGFIDVF